MPKDPTRNVGNYKIDGGPIDEYEFQKNQQKLAEEAKPHTASKDEKEVVGAVTEKAKKANE